MKIIKKAMILCAGFGRRLNPLTLSSPKPLLKIGNKTLLANTINFLQQLEIEEIVINVHYLGDQIINYVKNEKFDIPIKIIHEKDEILDTGGGIFNALKCLSKNPFLVINPDTIWNFDYVNELKLMEDEFIANKKNKCTLLVVDKKKSFDQSFKGDFNLEGNLITRNNKKSLNYIYTGIQIINPDAFEDINIKIFSINKIWDKLIQNNLLTGKKSKIDFLHITNLDIYKRLIDKF